MALDTSTDAYEQLFDASIPESSDKYYEGYVELKSTVFKWSKYWCVLIKKNLHFFKDVNTQIKENYVGFFPIDGVTNIQLKGSNNELQLIKKNRKISLKTQSSQLRDTWLESFKKSLKGEQPVPTSPIRPGSGPVSSRKHQPSIISHHHYSPSPSPHTQPVPSGSQKYQSKDIEYVRSIAENAEKAAADLRIQEQLMTSEESWYQPSFRREDVSEVLDEQKEGVFIVRDYIETASSRNMGYVISLKDNNGTILHHKILRTPNGNLYIKGHEGKRFDTLNNLLRFFVLSQRSTITLVPYMYNPLANERKERSRSLPPHPSDFFPSRTTKAVTRSQTIHDYRSAPLSTHRQVKSFKDRGLPPIPAVPECGPGSYLNMDGRPDSSQQPSRPAPRNGSDSADGCYINSEDLGGRTDGSDGYLHMKCPSDSFQRALDGDDSAFIPDDVYLNPVDQNLPGSTDGSDSYVDMQSPQRGRLERQSGVEISTPSSPNGCYENITSPSQSSYENFEPNPEEERAPKLPPKLPPKRRVQSFKDQSFYMNMPARDGPPRPPMRRVQTLDR